jgi:hypothetical protein
VTGAAPELVGEPKQWLVNEGYGLDQAASIALADRVERAMGDAGFVERALSDPAFDPGLAEVRHGIPALLERRSALRGIRLRCTVPSRAGSGLKLTYRNLWRSCARAAGSKFTEVSGRGVPWRERMSPSLIFSPWGIDSDTN